MRRSLRTLAARVNAPATGARMVRAATTVAAPSTRTAVGNLQVQRAATARVTASQTGLGAGGALPLTQRRALERFFATDLSHVRMYDDARAADAARSLHARAF